MGVPLPTRDQRRAVVLARWRLRRALMNTLDEIKIKRDGTCECEFCIQKAIADGDTTVIDRVAAKKTLTDIVDRIIRNKSGHYLSHSHDDANCVSYARNEQVKHLPERRTKTTLGRYIRRQFPDVVIADEFLEQYTNKVIAKLCVTDDRFKVIDGDAIVKAYRDAIGGNSCMTDNGADYTEIYALNPDVVKMLIYNDGSMTGRCLVWKTKQGHTVTDRIYPNGGRHIEEFNAYIKSRGWHQRENNAFPQGQAFIGLDGDLTVTLGIPDPPVYPYMDSLRYYSESRDVSWSSGTITLHTKHGCGMTDLSSTDGGGPGYEDRGRYTCHACGCRLDDEDTYNSRTGSMYCQRCYNERYDHCERCDSECDSDGTVSVRTGRWGHQQTWCSDCFEEGAFTCESCCDYFHNDSEVTIEGESYCTGCAERSSDCAECGERFFNSNMTERNGEWYCNDCLPEEEDEDDESESETEDDRQDLDRQAAEVAATA